MPRRRRPTRTASPGAARRRRRTTATGRRRSCSRELRRGPFGDEHDHGVERGEVDVGLDLHLLVEVGVGRPTKVTPPIGMPFGIERRELPGAPAGGDDLVADAARPPSWRRGRGRASRPDGPCRTIPAAPCGGRAPRPRSLVGEQAHAGSAGGRRSSRADEPVGRDDRRVRRDAVVGAGRDDDRLVERRRRPRDHLGRRRRCSRPGSAGALRYSSSALSLTFSCSADSFWITCCCSCSFSAFSRSFSERAVKQSVEPAVGVAERPRDPLDGDLEAAAARRGRRSARRARGPSDCSRNETVISASESRTSSPSTIRRRRALLVRESARAAERRTEAQHRRPCGAVAWQAVQSSHLTGRRSWREGS